MMLLVHLFLSSTTVLIHSSVLVSVVVIHQLSSTVSHPHMVVVTGLLPCSLLRKIFVLPVSLSFISVSVCSPMLVSVIIFFQLSTVIIHPLIVVLIGAFNGSWLMMMLFAPELFVISTPPQLCNIVVILPVRTSVTMTPFSHQEEIGVSVASPVVVIDILLLSGVVTVTLPFSFVTLRSPTMNSHVFVSVTLVDKEDFWISF